MHVRFISMCDTIEYLVSRCPMPKMKQNVPSSYLYFVRLKKCISPLVRWLTRIMYYIIQNLRIRTQNILAYMFAINSLNMVFGVIFCCLPCTYISVDIVCQVQSILFFHSVPFSTLYESCHVQNTWSFKSSMNNELNEWRKKGTA